jgi:hypothetical protein
MRGCSTLWTFIVDCIDLHYMHIWHLRIWASSLQFRASKINMVRTYQFAGIWQFYKYGWLMRISEIFLLENLSINVPYHRLTMTVKLIRRRHCINIVFIFVGQWKARVICGVLILEIYPWCVLPLMEMRNRLFEFNILVVYLKWTKIVEVDENCGFIIKFLKEVNDLWRKKFKLSNKGTNCLLSLNFFLHKSLTSFKNLMMNPQFSSTSTIFVHFK